MRRRTIELGQRLGRALLVPAFFAVAAVALMSPMASGSVIPDAPDHAIHTAYIVQARLALGEGQFPIRVAPWEHDGLRYAAYQFYCPLPCTLGAVIYKFLTPGNPFDAYRIVLWLSLFLAGYSMYRLARYLFRSPGAALLAGAAYMTAPYILINVHARGAMTEALAQGLLPFAIYYTLRSFASPRLYFVVASGIAWVALMLSHTLLWAYASLFVGLLLLLVAPFVRRPAVRLLRAGMGYLLSFALGAFFLGTLLLSSNALAIHGSLNDPGIVTWLTSLPALLSPTSVPSEPQPGHPTTQGLNPAVGLLLLLAAGVVAYVLVRERQRLKLRGGMLAAPLLAIFVLALLLTWSPYDIWTSLPEHGVLQFTYRLLAHTSWTGALLLALAVRAVLPRRVSLPHVAAGLVVIAIASSSYLPALGSSKATPESVAARPSFGYGTADFMLLPSADQPIVGGDVKPFLAPDGVLNPRSVDVRSLIGLAGARLRARGFTVEHEYPAGVDVVVRLNGVEAGRYHVTPGGTQYDIFDRDIPLDVLALPGNGAMLLSVVASAPSASGGTGLVFNELRVTGDGAGIRPVLAVTASQCVQEGATRRCAFDVPPGSGPVQLPELYYEDLVAVQADGHDAPYYATARDDVVLVTTDLSPGRHEVAMTFRGLAWANWLSAASWLAVAGFALWSAGRGGWRGTRRKRARAGSRAARSGKLPPRRVRRRGRATS